MSEVVCWCCEHFEPNYCDSSKRNVISGGFCKRFNANCLPEDSVCEEFLLRSGLHTSRTIPENCKLYENNRPIKAPENECITRALTIYDCLIDVFDKNGWAYTKTDEKLLIKSVIKTTNLFVWLNISVQPQKQLVQCISKLQMTVPEYKFSEICEDICTVNNNMYHGHFIYNTYERAIAFRSIISFYNSYINPILFEQMVLNTVDVVEHYNDRFDEIVKDGYESISYISDEYPDID